MSDFSSVSPLTSRGDRQNQNGGEWGVYSRRFGHADGVESKPGGSLNWSPAGSPGRNALNGDLVRLEILDPSRHAESLFTSSHNEGAERLWEHLAYGPFAGQDEFTAWLTKQAASADPLFFAVVDWESMRALGMASFMRMVPEFGVIEIGHIWFAPAIQQTRQATEAIYLLAKHAFDDLGNRRLEWKCDSLNEPSRRAAARFGFTYEGVFRQHMVVKGQNRDTAWYSIIDSEWPAIGAGFEKWLSEENQTGSGQVKTLVECRA
jgi:RimJ/RimL family protein N-acetyltransferase